MRRACTGQHCERCVHQPTRWSTLPSHVATRPPPPPLESEASEVASRHSHSGLAQPGSRWAVMSCAPRRVETPSPDGPADLEMFRTRTGRPVRVPRDFSLSVVLLPDWGNTRHGRAGTQLASGAFASMHFPHSDLLPRADAPRDSPSLADSSEEGPTDSETGQLVAPTSRSLETSCLFPGWDVKVLGDIPQEVVDTITSARAPSMRHAYALKWRETREEKTPGSARSASCSPFFRKGWSKGCLPPPSKSMLLRSLPTTTPWKGSRWRSMTGSSGSLGGQEDWILHAPPPPPFFTLLVSVSSAHSTTAGPVRAFADSRAEVPKKNSTPACTGLHHEGWGPTHISVNDLCLKFGPADSQIILRPWPGYVPKVLTTPFRARWWACKRFPRRRQTQP